MRKKCINTIICLIFIYLLILTALATTPVNTYQSDDISKQKIHKQQEIKISKIIAFKSEEIKDINCDVNYTEYIIPFKTKNFKSYMSHTLFSQDSSQYKIQEMSQTDENGLRVVDERYCVALGSYFNTEIGQYFDLVLENGTVIPCVMADAKADAHTDDLNIATVANGCVSEFIVSVDDLKESVKKAGNISILKEEWNSPVVSVKTYKKNILDGGKA